MKRKEIVVTLPMSAHAHTHTRTHTHTHTRTHTRTHTHTHTHRGLHPSCPGASSSQGFGSRTRLAEKPNFRNAICTKENKKTKKNKTKKKQNSKEP